jgi:hypothetical protein
MKYVFFITMLLGIFSCTTSTHSLTLDKAKLEQLANCSCRATTIRKERFELADNIRFTQDSLSKAKTKSESERLQRRLQGYLKQKDVLLKHSLALADTIRTQLDSLVPYTNKQAQKKFKASLDSSLASKGCKG